MTPEAAYISALFGVIAIILWGGGVDFTLWLRSEQTISQWLRMHPVWWHVPLAGMLFFLALLHLHLFVGLWSE
jgi:hypothetical protein